LVNWLLYLMEGRTTFLEDKTETTMPLETVDRFGVYVSAACALHCLALPLLLAGVPAVGILVLIGEGLEMFLGIGAVLLAVACLCWGFRIHRKKHLFLTFAAAAAFILAGQLFAEGWLETTLVVTGALGLIGSHLLNRKLCRSCHSCDQHAH
jgi:hypothetical protein